MREFGSNYLSHHRSDISLLNTAFNKNVHLRLRKHENTSIEDKVHLYIQVSGAICGLIILQRSTEDRPTCMNRRQLSSVGYSGELHMMRPPLGPRVVQRIHVFMAQDQQNTFGIEAEWLP